MMIYNPIPISALKRGDESYQTQLITQLKQRGFALLQIDLKDRADAIKQGLLEAAQLKGFRFPPINVDEVHYQPIHRMVFSALYQTAIDCLSLFAHKHIQALAQVDALFSHSLHDPFPKEHLFHPTFFNLFNYDHGSLNAHQDRGLLTIIHVEPPTAQNQPCSALWVEDPQGTWHNADFAVYQQVEQAPQSCFALLLLGEEGELHLSSQHRGLYAAEHAVRVDPSGDYLEHSHHQRDPAAFISGNRRSAALILRASQPELCFE